MLKCIFLHILQNIEVNKFKTVFKTQIELINFDSLLIHVCSKKIMLEQIYFLGALVIRAIKFV